MTIMSNKQGLAMALFKDFFLFPLNAYSVSCPTRSKNLESTLIHTLGFTEQTEFVGHEA